MKIFALLIGLNHYHPASMVTPLKGCESDVLQMKSFLEDVFPAQDLRIQTLLNEQATYQNIIDHFGESHLMKARTGDAVLVHFSGHGARETAAPEFADYYPEQKQETLICYDSRLPGQLDLADKELGVLIARIARKGVHLVLVLDCCHAGSGTRDTGSSHLGAARQWDDRDEARPLDRYLDGYFVGNVHLPNSQHILLAACEKRQKAYELTTHSGHFTRHLLEVLRQYQGRLSYAELFNLTRHRMFKLNARQHPQFEPSGFFNPYHAFLGLKAEVKGADYPLFYRDESWQLELGLVQGRPTTGQEKAIFEIYHDGELIGFAESRRVLLNRCILATHEPLDPDTDYRARLISLPSPALPVALLGDEEGLALMEKAMDHYQAVYFELFEKVKDTLYQLHCFNGRLRLLRTPDQLEICTAVGNPSAAVKEVFQRLEHLCRWEKTLQLEREGPREVFLQLELMDEQRNVLRRISDPEVLIDIVRENGADREVAFRLKIVNESRRAWHAALFYLSGNYGIYTLYQEQLPARSTAIAMEYNAQGQAYAFTLKQKESSTDIFKIIVSQQPFDAHLLNQQGLQLGEEITASRSSMGRQPRSDQESWADWFSCTMCCMSKRKS